MFPWLPFLTFPSQTKSCSNRNRRRLRKVHQEPNTSTTAQQQMVAAAGRKTSVHSIGSILKIEYISHPMDNHPTTISRVQSQESVAAKLEKEQAQMAQQQQNAKARQRASFETSTEMLELFGGRGVATSEEPESPEISPIVPKPNRISLKGSSKVSTKEASPPNSARKEISPVGSGMNSRKTSPAPCPALHSSRPNSSQNIRASPVEQAKINAAVVKNTPPAVRAAKAREKAFQPSSAMLEMFAGGAEDKLDAPSVLIAKSGGEDPRQDISPSRPASNLMPLISEPGPEHFEDTKTSTSCCSSPEELSPTAQVEHLPVHKPTTTRYNGHPELQEHSLQKDKQPSPSTKRGAAGSRYVNALSSSSPFFSPPNAQAIQLSDPGPELPFDEEEEEGEEEEQAVHDSFNGQHIIQQQQAEAAATTHHKPHNYIGHKEGGQENLASNHHPEKTYIEEEADIKAIKHNAATSIKGGQEHKEAEYHQHPVDNHHHHHSLPTPCKLSDGAGEKTGGADWKNTVASGASSFSSRPQESNLFGGSGGSGSGGGMVIANASEEGGSEAGGGAGAAAGSVLLIRHAQIINDDEMFAADIWIENGIVKKISSQSLKAPEGAQVIEANGRWVLPAGIDVHTQFSANSSSEDFSVGTKAALAGGTATIIDTVYTRNESESLLAAFDRVRSSIPGKAQCNVGLSVVVSHWKGEKTRLEMSSLVREKGVNSFVLELSSDSEIFEALEHSKELGAHCRILPENKEMSAVLEKRLTRQQKGLSATQIYVDARPAKLEAEQIHRVCVLSQLVNSPFSVLSVTSSEASQALRNGRKEGVLVSAEVPVAAIASGADSSTSKGPLTRIPLRPQSAHSEDALELLANNPLCMCVSDHHITKSASTLNGMVKNSASGIIPSSAGIEQRMSVLWEKAVVQLGKLDPMRFVAVTSSNAAKMFNIYPRKGRVAVGSDADVVLWDFDSSRQLCCPLTPFHQISVHATPAITICAGQVLYSDGNFVGLSKAGPASKIQLQDYFVALDANSPYVFGMVQLREKTFNLSLQAVGRGKPEHEVEDSGQSRRTSVASSVCSGIIDERPRPGSSSSTTANYTKKTAETRSSTATGSRNRNIQSNDPPKRSATKVIQPPGGKSTGFW